jgi:hypothetical protein
MSHHPVLKSLLVGTALLATGAAYGADVVVTEFKTPGPIVPDSWYSADVKPGGTATIRDLTGLGGNLQSAQPLPSGAARLTTDSTNAAKAEVATYADFGLANVVLSNPQRQLDLAIDDN